MGKLVMDLEEEVRALRARLDAADLLIENLLAWLIVNESNEFKKRMILAGIKMAAEFDPITPVLPDDLAMEHADRIVMTREAVRTRLARIAPFFEPPVEPLRQAGLEEGER